MMIFDIIKYAGWAAGEVNFVGSWQRLGKDGCLHSPWFWQMALGQIKIFEYRWKYIWRLHQGHFGRWRISRWKNRGARGNLGGNLTGKVKWLLSFFHIRYLMICLTNYQMHNADRRHDSKWDLPRNPETMGVVSSGCRWRKIWRGGENSCGHPNCQNYGAASPLRCPPEEGIWWRKETETKHLVAICRGNIHKCRIQEISAWH